MMGQRSFTSRYNSFGKTTKVTDPAALTAYLMTPTIDLLEVRQQTGGINELSRQLHLQGQHLPLTVTDAFRSDDELHLQRPGQVRTITNANSEVHHLQLRLKRLSSEYCRGAAGRLDIFYL